MCIRDSLYIFPDSVCAQLLPVMRNRYITTDEAISYNDARELEQVFTEQDPELADTGVSYSIRLSTLQVNSTKAGNFVLQAAMLYQADWQYVQPLHLSVSYATTPFSFL